LAAATIGSADPVPAAATKAKAPSCAFLETFFYTVNDCTTSFVGAVSAAQVLFNRQIISSKQFGDCQEAPPNNVGFTSFQFNTFENPAGASKGCKLYVYTGTGCVPATGITAGPTIVLDLETDQTKCQGGTTSNRKRESSLQTYKSYKVVC